MNKSMTSYASFVIAPFNEMAVEFIPGLFIKKIIVTILVSKMRVALAIPHNTYLDLYTVSRFV
jgi:hypothetical protein